MTATATAAASAAPQAAAKGKTPEWLTLATLDDLNAYLKKAKIGGDRAESMRQRWTAARPTGAEESVSVTDPALAEHPEAKKNAASWPDGKKKINGAQPALASAADVKAVADRAADRILAKRPAAPAPGLVTRYIDPTMIDVQEGWNARYDFGDIQELAASIKAQKKIDGHGLINDIRVKEKPDGRYALIDGERRLHSVMYLIEQEGEVFEFGIPSKVEPADATDAELIIKMFTANTGKPFLPYEEAMYYKRLRDGDPARGIKGMTIAQIEERTGRSDNSIVGALALLEADEDLVEATIKGTVGATLAKSIAVNVRGNRAKQKELVAKAKAAGKAKDKAAMKHVHKEIDDERRKKAARKAPGLKLKARKADEDEIAQLGAETGARLKELMEKLGLPFDTDMHEWVSNDRELQVAASFGALTALRAVMGDKTAKVKF